MTGEPDVIDLAEALRTSVGLLLRRLRQTPVEGELTLPESSALTRLDRGGPTTPGALAKLEQISPQSIGATLGALETRGLVERQADPADRRKVVMSLTETGREVLRNRRNEHTEHLARALATEFTFAERRQLCVAAPLIERLAQCI